MTTSLQNNHASSMKYRLSDIEANPHRRINHYPILRPKVDALKESIQKTGYWDNILARPHPTKSGKVQIAFAHHRMCALRELYPPTKEIELIVRDLSDTDMLLIMSRENMEEWGSSAWVEIETVHAVVQAFADGLIELEKPNAEIRKEVLRIAPSFVPSKVVREANDLSYTTGTVARFLGWVKPSGQISETTRMALDALEFIERDLLTETQLKDLNRTQVAEMIAAQRMVMERRESQAKYQAEQARVQKAREEELAAKAKIAAAEDAHKYAQLQKQVLRARLDAEAAAVKAIESQAKAHTDAQMLGHEISRELSRPEKEKRLSTGNIRSEARKFIFETAKKEHQKLEVPPYLDDVADKLQEKVGRFFLDESLMEQLEEIVKYKDSLHTATRKYLVASFTKMSRTAAQYAQEFGIDPSTPIKSAQAQPVRNLLK